jgi:Ca2+-binding RTX toxin-like protein
LSSNTENTAVFTAVADYLKDSSVPTAKDGGDGSYLWIGANDIAKEGSWNWIDGTALSDTSWGKGSVTEPDNFTHKTLAPQGQDAAAIALTAWPQGGGIGLPGQWNDLAVTDKLWFLVEYENTTGASKIVGGSAGDILMDNSTQGDKTLAGGKGSDTYLIEREGQNIEEKAGEGTDTVVTTLARYSLADTLENLQYTGQDSFTGTGNKFANTIEGSSGDDTLNGEGGNDTLKGAAGNDTLAGGSGADILIGGSGDDTYEIDNAADKIVETADVNAAGRADIDTVRTTLGAYSLNSLALANVENLQYTVTGAANFTGTGNAGSNQLTGGVGKDMLNGLAGNDTLTGLAGDDKLLGGAGDDRFLMENGNDSYDGGADTDTLYLAGNADNYSFTIPVTGTVRIEGNGRIISVSNVEKIIFADAPETERLLNIAGPRDLLAMAGSTTADLLTGNDQNNTINGLAGDDQITGGAGMDTLYGGLGNDTLTGDAGIDILEGGAGNDTYRINSYEDTIRNEAAGVAGGIDSIELSTLTTFSLVSPESLLIIANVENLIGKETTDLNLTGNALSNAITGNIGNDQLFGLVGNDTLFGGEGNDTLDGGLGADRMEGGNGNDSYLVDNALDLVKDTAGDADSVTVTTIKAYTMTLGIEDLTYNDAFNFTGNGNIGNNRMVGGSGNDTLNGQGGNDTLSGLDGKDVLNGGSGDDKLIGGAGADVLTGGVGADYFVFNTLTSDPLTADKVTDFVGQNAAAAAKLSGIDHLAFDNGIYSALNWNPDGSLADGQFVSGKGMKEATEASQHLIYDTATGSLYYDTDGVGGEAAYLVATFANKAALVAADFSMG